MIDDVAARLERRRRQQELDEQQRRQRAAERFAEQHRWTVEQIAATHARILHARQKAGRPLTLTEIANLFPNPKDPA